MRALAGRILTPEGWLEGHVLVEAGRVAEVAAGPAPAEPVATGTVVPAFVNAHTHLGDAVARGMPIPAGLAEAVKPPYGFKHRVLASTPEPELVAGMRQAVREVEASGCAGLVDFREGGLRGLAQLRAALEGSGLRARVYARPSGPTPREGELEALLRGADGLSASSLPDDPGLARALGEAAKRAGKGLALHASEAAREPLDEVLDLGPELLVHLTFATRGDLEAVRDAGCIAAVCPRSSARWTKRVPDVRAMLDLGLPVALGTDNAMLGPCDVLAEARALLDLEPRLAPREALAMLCSGGWKALRPGGGIEPLAPGAPADLLVFRAQGARPEADVLGPQAALLHRERGLGPWSSSAS